jgi:hypothetical protein
MTNPNKVAVDLFRKMENGSKLHQVAIWCPACNTIHAFDLNRWTFNGDYDKPTFSPSMLVNHDDPMTRCHSFVKDGSIRFLGDCWHDMKNKTVELEQFPLYDDSDDEEDAVN